MERELVSVIVVGYNNWPDLELAIQSALCQSHQPVEVLVIDNSSQDETSRDVPRLFGDRVRYVRQPNTGDSGAYNTGIRMARGNYIQFLDGDDVLAPYKFEKQLEVFRADPLADVVYGDVRCFLSPPGLAGWVELATPAETGDMLKAFLGGGGMIHFVGSLFSRVTIERVGMFDESLYNADVDYELRAFWAGCRFRSCPGNPMAFYRYRTGQMSSNRPAMISGNEAVWAKAATFVNREPYKSLVLKNLTWARFIRATRRYEMTPEEALAKLREARNTNPSLIPWGLYKAGQALILVPGAAEVMRSDAARDFRRRVATLLGFEVP